MIRGKQRCTSLIIVLAVIFLFGSLLQPVVWAETGLEENAAENAAENTEVSTTWDGISVDTSWYTEHQDESSYTIHTAAELAGLAKLVNDMTAYFYGKTVTLAADIDLAGDPSTGKNKWTPIGIETEDKETTAFLGTFDGAGHTVSGIYVDGTVNGSGFFGTLAGEAELKNLTVSGTILSNEMSTGGLVGRVPFQADKCLITDCVNNCSVTSSYTHIGGIIGYNGGCDIVRCVNNGAVILNGKSGNTGIAGIVGSLAYGDVNQCVNTGPVTINVSDESSNLNANNAGGIAGLMNSESADDTSIVNCYNRGNISNNNGKEDAGSGGVVGKADCIADIHNSYSTGEIKGMAGATGGVIGLADMSEGSDGQMTLNKLDVKNTYYLENTVNGGNGGIAGSASDDEVNGTLAKSLNDMKTLASSLGAYYASDTDGSVNDGYPVLKWQIGQSVDPGTGEDPDPLPDPEKGWDGISTDVTWYTDHESEASYTIETPEQLAGLAKLVNEGQSFSGKQVLLGADIDLNGKAWTPIGTQSAYSGTNFTGTFDGQYHTVSGFTCEQNLAGLFSILPTASSVKNLGIADADIRSSASSSYNTGVGAIAAILKAGSPAGAVIENCWTAKDVKISAEKTYVGGIAGQIGSGYGGTAPMISGCVNNADVSSIYAGGILGSGASTAPIINNCYNAGVICCLAANSVGSAGGLVGSASTYTSVTVSNSYNIGTVLHLTSSYAETKTGSICGANAGTYSDVYYLSGSSSGKAAGGSDRDDIKELNSESLKRIVTILNLNQDGVWTTDTAKNNGYPILSWQAKVSSSAPSVQSLKIAEPPTKTSYGEGEYLDLTGMKVVLIYSDGSEKELEHYLMEPDLSTMLTADVTEFRISCNGFETSQSIMVSAATGIRITQPPVKTTYISGEKFDDEGMVVELTYSDGTSAAIMDYELSPDISHALTGNDERIVVSYGDYSVVQPIHVKTPVGIRITTMPEQTEYKAGEYFKQYGMKICVDFNDGTSSEPSSDFTVQNANAELTADMEGVRIVSKKYKDLPAIVCPIEVIGVESMKITTPPSKTNYTEGEKFDKSGMVVMLYYENGEKEEISSGYGGYTIEESSRKLCSQDTEIRLTYDVADESIETTCPVSVAPNGQGERSLKITKKDSFKDLYKEGDSFSSSAITVEYFPGTAEPITLNTSDYEYMPKCITADTEYITVTYGGLTATEKIDVTPAEKMEVTGPKKTVYNVGDVVNNSGITVKLVFSDSTTKTINNTAYTRTPDASTPLTAGDKGLLFRFGAKEVLVPLTILSKVEPVTSSVEPGMISMPAEVALSTETEGATIYYTTDGSEPTSESAVYSGPISLSGDMTINAIAMKEGMGDSEVSKFVYVKKGRVADVSSNTPSGKIDMPAEVELSTPVEGATIYYTTDGSEPTPESAVYSGPISVMSNVTIKAIAVKEGFENSKTAEFSYWRDAAAVVTATPEPGTISMPAEIALNTETEGATIHYTLDGSEPTSDSAVYSEPLTLMDTTTIKAIAVKEGFENSEVSTFSYTKMGQVAVVTTTPEPGTISMPAEIALNTETEGATIHYTLDGSEPTSDSAVYSEPLTLMDTTTIKAIAVKEGFENSEVSTFSYTKMGQVAVVTATPEPGTISMPAEIALNTETEGATIHYTLDGSEPTSDSAVYSEPLTLMDTTTVKAIAVKEGFENSEIAVFEYEKKSSGSGGGSGGSGGNPSKPAEPEDPVDPDEPVEPEDPAVDVSRFKDIDASSWYYDSVRYVVEKNWMNGVSEDRFEPANGVTRGMFVTVLGRISGVDTAGYNSCKFDDVANDAYYAPYVQWASENNIVQGVGEKRFEPDRMITRQEMAVLVHKYRTIVQQKAGSSVKDFELSGIYSDTAEIADWAFESVIYCTQNGILQGKGGSVFDPVGTTTRAELAVLLQRLEA